VVATVVFHVAFVVVVATIFATHAMPIVVAVPIVHDRAVGKRRIDLVGSGTMCLTKN
jgi:hypothetical protein